jgi:hypothetical protein
MIVHFFLESVKYSPTVSNLMLDSPQDWGIIELD